MTIIIPQVVFKIHDVDNRQQKHNNKQTNKIYPLI